MTNPSIRTAVRAMSRKSFLPALASALLCATLPAYGRQKPRNLPDGPGKDQVAALCSGCQN